MNEPETIISFGDKIGLFGGKKRSYKKRGGKKRSCKKRGGKFSKLPEAQLQVSVR